MAKSIMIQGTMSNAGKSFLVAGLLRILKQDGYKVAPFKSQNMALNSYITEEGLEMGRAQVMQAEAAGIKPSVRMNPILLKPTTDMGSQVIVCGEVQGNMQARDYFKMKKSLIPKIKEAYDSLAEEYDIIVIEGAGSPAEINLKADDIVNMGMAKLVDAPVLLAGDIDRGGVFAQLYGTVMLLEEEERARIKGTIINKFRGDATILKPGLDMIYEKIHIPCAGVVPYMNVDIEDEDSLTERFHKKREVAPVEIAVIKLPRISNFTDFYSLEHLEGVGLHYVSDVSELKSPDMIILPGSKSTIQDLIWLRENGLEAAIKKEAAKGTLIFGICGGYQMLGMSIDDSEMVEGIRHIRGMELLPIKTTFTTSKVMTQATGHTGTIEGPYAALSNIPVTGYEVHMGISTPVLSSEDIPSANVADQTHPSSCPSFTQITVTTESATAKSDGSVLSNIAGTYLHGIFDTESMQKAVLDLLYTRKGLTYDASAIQSYDSYKESQYDHLASILRESLDMPLIYEILGLTPPLN
ncbi:MAG: cobyric acid synthase [Lachnospiraceae bacterium]|nr:cobyric acid synthase [Lachnospiraceae bacterium]